jgi:geranylgeranyl pyrophosphate synthase
MMSGAVDDKTVGDRLAAWAREFDPHLEALLSESPQVSERLAEAMCYSALLPGKRVRPYLVTEVGSLLGAAPEDTRPAALAIECVHAFSLIHDDLPAMDDDDLRRGKPTNHKVFGEGMAVLAGDALLALAFEVLVTRARSPQIAAGWVAELAEATGRRGIIGGQAADIQGETQPLDAELVGRIHRSKTARLIQSTCRLGAIAAGAGSEDYRAVSDYGLQAGLAFQMADDLLDVTSDRQSLGKHTAKDTDSGKQTYVRALGVERARDLVHDKLDLALEALVRFGARADNLRDLARFVVERDH